MPALNQTPIPPDRKEPRERLAIKFSPLEIKIDQITVMAIIFLALVLAFIVILLKF